MKPELQAWRDVCYEDLAVLVTEPIVSRGRDYLRQGQVGARLVAEERLAGSVMGSNGWYVTTATLVGGEIKSTCTCPYQGTPCKHAVALILCWLADPLSFLDLEAEPRLYSADPGELRRLNRELCLAAPQAAVSLLTGRDPDDSTAVTYAAMARNLLAWPQAAVRNPEALAERLAWVGGKVAGAVTAGDQGAIDAALDLVEKLFAVWRDAPTTPRLAEVIGEYVRRLAEAWPAGKGSVGSGPLTLTGTVGAMAHLRRRAVPPLPGRRPWRAGIGRGGSG